MCNLHSEQQEDCHSYRSNLVHQQRALGGLVVGAIHGLVGHDVLECHFRHPHTRHHPWDRALLSGVDCLLVDRIVPHL